VFHGHGQPQSYQTPMQRSVSGAGVPNVPFWPAINNNVNGPGQEPAQGRVAEQTFKLRRLGTATPKLHAANPIHWDAAICDLRRHDRLAKCYADGNSSLPVSPPPVINGIVIFDQWDDFIVDGSIDPGI